MRKERPSAAFIVLFFVLATVLAAVLWHRVPMPRFRGFVMCERCGITVDERKVHHLPVPDGCQEVEPR